MGAAPPLPADASATLYVEGLPRDATEREVAHIFRRFEGQGYASIRIFPKESKSGHLLLCFVEFDFPVQAHAAMQQLQGYRLDRRSDASPALKISFSRRRDTRPPPPTDRREASCAISAATPVPPTHPPMPPAAPPPVLPPRPADVNLAPPGGDGEASGRAARWNPASAASADASPIRSPRRRRSPSRGHRRDGRGHRDGEADDEDEDELEYEAHAGGDAMEGLEV